MIPAWLVIAGVAIAIGTAGSAIPTSGRKWFRHLQRPAWLTIEQFIPLIWTVVFICGGWSAYIVWEQNPGSGETGWLMAGYALLELVTVSYTVAMLRTQKLTVGLVIGASGLVIGLILAGLVLQIQAIATLLLLPYLLWSPVGTFITWQMMQLNPDQT
ncbi:TspO protein [filamentous cyanobacterium CCP5]|nr:TspO protein [filamentous cyanobacterium CCP5]